MKIKAYNLEQITKEKIEDRELSFVTLLGKIFKGEVTEVMCTEDMNNIFIPSLLYGNVLEYEYPRDILNRLISYM